MDGKTKAVIAHITLIGWGIALILNSSEKDEFASYYIRQTLGIWLFCMIISIIPVLNIIGLTITFILWLISLTGSIQGEKKEIPIVGKYFHEWFNGL